MKRKLDASVSNNKLNNDLTTIAPDDKPLYVHKETLNCASNGCIPCWYKLCPTGYYMNMRLPVNVRPELCPRSSQLSSSLRYYLAGDNILTLGDGDLSFSKSVLSLMQSQSIRNENLDNMSHYSNLVATTHEPFTRLQTVYPNCEYIINSLREFGVDVRHEVDATALEKSFSRSAYSNYFDYIIWNFPCIRMQFGADGQVKELQDNKLLIQNFFANCAYLLKHGGEIHITHKTVEPFSWWGIEQIAEQFGFVCMRRIVFDRCLYPGYVNRKVLDNKSFPSHDARVSLILMIL